ncbi:MAG: S1 RNA-binding domain-containing protein [Oscillospiraceae bacterium]|jgi:S1 RNA binding domain protein|nr:S1 RNA-binding domain-containing protein [Oscillospiraceae bacterium]
MQLEIGAIIEGKVTGITKFGAFVELPGGKTGMVHISEVSNAYVKEIGDHLSENQVVKVKVLKISPDGKVSLSIKKCAENLGGPPSQGAPGGPSPRPAPQRGGYRGRDMGWQGKKPSAEPSSFEDMLSKFKVTSEDKMSDLKRNNDTGRRPRKGPPKP